MLECYARDGSCFMMSKTPPDIVRHAKRRSGRGNQNADLTLTDSLLQTTMKPVLSEPRFLDEAEATTSRGRHKIVSFK
ncbi:hypothetical protein H4V95_001206 [Arthrobacter sp. CAN_C5]|nr:hypothetical protein [Arthrobacter sp. CAN_C5]